MANRIETGLRIKGLSGDTNALYVTGNSFIQGDVNITGNVNVIGTATTLNTETVQTRDNKILLNYSGTNLTAIGGGISVLSANTIYTSGLTELITDINGDWNSNVGLNITGRTSDSSSNGLTVKNSGGTDNFVVRNDGNIGIGTSAPNAPLDVNGKIYSRTGGVYTDIIQVYNATDLNIIGFNDTLFINNVERLRIKNNGNVGIGTSAPNAKLHINNTTSGNTVLFEDDTSPDPSPFVIDNVGKVGIGTFTPSEKLDVSGKTKTTNFQMTSGATSGYVLTAIDGIGNSVWLPKVYSSGNIIEERWNISNFAGTVLTNGTATPTNRGGWILDLGDTSKWAKSGCTGPVITYRVVSYNSGGATGSTCDLFNRSTSTKITGSDIIITSTTTTNIQSVTISQSNFPSTPTLVIVRHDNGGLGTNNLLLAEIVATWTVI